MKSFLLCLLVCLSSFSFAGEGKLQKNDTSVSFISGGQLAGSKIVPSCTADGSHCMPMIEQSVTLFLNGCLDRLGPVSVKIEESDSGLTIIKVAAINIATKASESARCIDMPKATIKVNFPANQDLEKLILQLM